MKNVLLFCLLLVSGLAAAQRGAIPLNDLSGIIQPAPFNALVIGISDYSSEKLRLKYARRDAELFAAFLSRSNWADTVVTLYDEQATATAIYESINQLINGADEGEDIYIYFAGHGDKLDLGRRSKAYLLAYDASDSRNYQGTGGVIDLQNLELDINDLIQVTGSRVFLVVDACHSGFTPLEGAGSIQQLFNDRFQVANKLLSCQPDELSFENDHIRQGVFTYQLIRGLSGLADQPANGEITLDEVRKFLEIQVPLNAPGPQHPRIVTADSSQVVGKVSRELLAEVQLNTQLALGGDNRGKGEKQTGEIDPAITALVKDFNSAMRLGMYYGEGPSCLTLIRRSESVPGFPMRLTKRMRSLLAEELLVSAQLSINEILRGKVQLPSSAYYSQQAQHLKVCLELLEDKNPQKEAALISHLFLQAYSILRAEKFESYNEAMDLLDSAIVMEKRAAYLYHAKGLLHSYRDEYDSAIFYYDKALELIPNWLFPMNSKGNALKGSYRYDQAIPVFESVIRLDSSFSSSYNNLANVYLSIENYAKAEGLYLETLNHSSDDSAMVFHNLGVLATYRGNLRQAQNYYFSALGADSTYYHTYIQLGDFYTKHLMQTDSAVMFYQKAIELQPYYAGAYSELADFYRHYGQDDSDYLLADSLYRQSIELNPYEAWPWFAYAYLLRSEFKQEKKADSLVLASAKWNAPKAAYWFELGRYFKGRKSPMGDSAMLYFEKAIETDSFYRHAYSRLARHYAGSDPKKAEAYLTRYASLNPGNPRGWTDLGDLYYASGDIEKSRRNYEKALEIDPAFTTARLSLSVLYLDEGKVTESLETYLLALKSNPIALDKQEYLSYALLRVSEKVKKGERHQAVLELLVLDSYSARLNIAALSYAYKEGLYDKDLPSSDSLIAAVTESPVVKSQLLYYKCLMAIERKDTAGMNTWFALYLENTLRPDLALLSVVKYLNGKSEEALAAKEEFIGQGDTPNEFGPQFQIHYRRIQ